NNNQCLGFRQSPLHAHSLESVMLQRLQRLPQQIKRQRHMLTEERDMARKYWQLLQNIMDEMPDKMPLPPRREEPRSSREPQQVQQPWRRPWACPGSV
ncbi:MAG: hypothetical protein ACKPKO_54915, partial [Candidatus Fonsibacter sp.]